MNLDLRLPIGLLFSIFGAILVGYGLLTPPETYAQSLGININLNWGVVLCAFGGIMLTFALRARGKAEAEARSGK